MKELSHKEILERVLKLQRIIDAKGLPVVIQVGYMSSDKYTYVAVENIKTDKGKYSMERYINDTNKFIKEVKKLCVPVWINLDKICIEAIGKTFWEDKEIEVEVLGIDKQGVLVEQINGDVWHDYYVDAKNLWIKEG